MMKDNPQLPSLTQIPRESSQLNQFTPSISGFLNESLVYLKFQEQSGRYFKAAQKSGSFMFLSERVAARREREAAMAAQKSWESVQVQGPDSTGVATLTLHRPSHFNALNPSLFKEIPAAIRALDLDPAVRVVILNAAGPHFCSGIDLSHHFTTAVGSAESSACLGREKEKLRRDLTESQDAFNAFEECRKPVIAAIHGACIGGGIEMVTACDLRYCTQDATFCMKEVDTASTAGLGTLQRLPKLIGHGNTMELALTARKFSGVEAKAMGLVQGVLQSKRDLEAHVQKLASEIALKSPMAVMGSKMVALKSRDMTVAQGLEYVGLWNATMLESKDLHEAMQARVHKRLPRFSNL